VSHRAEPGHRVGLLPYPMPPGAAGAQGAPRAAPPARRHDAHQPDLPQVRRLLLPVHPCHLVAHAPRPTRINLTFRRCAACCRRCAGVTWQPTPPARVWHTPSCETRRCAALRCAAGRAGACPCAAPCRACTGGACPVRQSTTWPSFSASVSHCVLAGPRRLKPEVARATPRCHCGRMAALKACVQRTAQGGTRQVYFQACDPSKGASGCRFMRWDV